MLDAMTKFASCCRSSGIEISISEIIDCLQQLTYINILDETQFKTVLKANFVKNHDESERFDHIYQHFFHPSQAGEVLDIGDDEAEYADGPFRSLLTSNSAGGNDTVIRFDLGDILTEQLGLASNLYQEGLESELIPEIQEQPGQKNRKQLGELPFSHLTLQETREIHSAISQLANKLKDSVTRRYKKKNRGAVDIKKTLRRSGRYQGVPFEISYRNHLRRKTKIVALCDLSYSVWSAVPFMLNILYSMQECFSQVKTFTFVSTVSEVSHIFEGKTVTGAIDKIMTDVEFHYPSRAVYGDPGTEGAAESDQIEDQEISDYGNALSDFRTNYLDTLDTRTTLIIMGDGRSNFFDPQEVFLDEIRARCRRIIWLNPEPEHVWNTGDSILKVYEPYCHEIRPCYNLNLLLRFIKDFMLH